MRKKKPVGKGAERNMLLLGVIGQEDNRISSAQHLSKNSLGWGTPNCPVLATHNCFLTHSPVQAEACGVLGFHLPTHSFTGQTQLPVGPVISSKWVSPRSKQIDKKGPFLCCGLSHELNVLHIRCDVFFAYVLCMAHVFIAWPSTVLSPQAERRHQHGREPGDEVRVATSLKWGLDNFTCLMTFQHWWGNHTQFIYGEKAFYQTMLLCKLINKWCLKGKVSKFINW